MAQTGTIPARRQSDRIHYAYHLRITGTSARGAQFDETGRTEVITRDGGLIITALSLPNGAVVRLTRGIKSVEARVIGQVGLREDEYLYGMQFVETPASPFWEVNFPALTTDESVGKVVLQCSRCSRQEVLHISEVEMIVFETMKVIPRQCPKCGIETLWMEPVILGDGALLNGSAAFEVDVKQAFRRRDINDRKHARLQMRNAKACLRRPNGEMDVVNVVNLSRGGIAFMSTVDYVPGTQVEVAVPFTEGGANVFTPAKIVRVRCRPTADFPGEFGLEYIKH